MIARCTNPNHISFPRYGGRGITVCARWLRFDDFLADMGIGKTRWTLERVDNNIGYEPSNVVWARVKLQNRNSRHNRVFTVLGRTGCLSELCEHFNVSYSMAKFRLRKGLPIDRAFFDPCRYSTSGKWDPMYNGKTPQLDVIMRPK